MRSLVLIRSKNIVNGGIKWSPEEDAAIREHYPKMDGREILAAMFPHRTSNAFYKRAHVLGVKGPHRGGLKIQHMPHNCEYCGQLVPINGMTGYAYNKKLCCSQKCALKLAYKRKIERGTLVTKRHVGESPQLVAALAARDRGDHSLLREILRG